MPPYSYGNLYLQVTVEDVNDNAPNFEQSHYKLTIGENARLGDKFIIKAKDRDAGMNALVRYSFDKRVPAFLGLDKYDGHISITSAIPEIGSNYQFTVLATDRGILLAYDEKNTQSVNVFRSPPT